MSDLLERTAEHEFPHRDVLICMKPGLITDRDVAMARVAAARRSSTTSTPGADDQRQVAPVASADLVDALAAVTEIEEQIKAASITLRITGVDRLRYNRFILANPPRRGKQEHFDSSKFFTYVARQTGTYIDRHGAEHPILDEEWAALDEKIDDGTYDRIAEAVLEVNRTLGGQTLGFFANGSERTPDSSETSD